MREAIERLADRDPTATSNLVRQHLASRFAEGNQRNVAGPNQWGGAKFAADVAGNDLQRENLIAALGALPNAEKAAPHFGDLLRVFEAQGTRQRLGSPTQQRTQKSQEMSHPNLAVDLTAGALASAGTNLLTAGGSGWLKCGQSGITRRWLICSSRRMPLLECALLNSMREKLRC